uniref:Uncharacterized protein n=1 Tax=Glossina pallidipes TaxID=7398 RepID=A0A1B0A1D0_GLOPL
MFIRSLCHKVEKSEAISKASQALKCDNKTALLLPAALSYSRHANDSHDIRRNLRLRYHDSYKHNRELEKFLDSCCKCKIMTYSGTIVCEIYLNRVNYESKAELLFSLCLVSGVILHMRAFVFAKHYNEWH